MTLNVHLMGSMRRFVEMCPSDVVFLFECSGLELVAVKLWEKRGTIPQLMLLAY